MANVINNQCEAEVTFLVQFVLPSKVIKSDLPQDGYLKNILQVFVFITLQMILNCFGFHSQVQHFNC